MGVPAYVELQLHPERIADGRVEARVAALPTLGLSSAELYARFEAPVREARKRLKAEKADAARRTEPAATTSGAGCARWSRPRTARGESSRT